MVSPKDNYIVTRDDDEAKRLEDQHRYITSCQGYYIHPTIHLPATGARIADLGTGTSIWLLEVAEAVPATECHGFDISDRMFPAKLPPNISLHIADIKKPFENRWQGYFDVVHVRLVMCAMRLSEWRPVLQNIATLLKSGGWLQWYEDDRAHSVRHAVRPVAPLDAAARSLSSGANGQAGYTPPHASRLAHFNRLIMDDERAEAMTHAYMNLDALMADSQVGNLQQVDCDAFVIDRTDDGGKLRRDWAAMGVPAVRSMLKSREEAGEKAAENKDEWARDAMKEVEAGVHYVTRAAVFIGRKSI